VYKRQVVSSLFDKPRLILFVTILQIR